MSAIGVLLVFGAVVLMGRFFGAAGLTTWMSLATVLANIIVSKQVTVFGLNTTLGSILFASTFLATDIISEVYGEKSSKKAVGIASISSIVFIVTTQYALCYVPNALDYASEGMKILFPLSIRVSVASVVMSYVANVADVHLFELLKKKIPGKLWLRNNIATIVCNCTENFLFITLAFIGIYSFKDCMMIALSSSLFETLIAICDTPFAYIGRKVAKRD